jgi:hypothetical protein
MADSADTDHKAAALVAELRGFAEAHKVGSIRIDMDDIRTLLSRLSEVEGERDEAHRYLDRLEQARTEGEGEGDEVLTLKGRILNLDSERRAAIMERDAALASIPATTGDA